MGWPCWPAWRARGPPPRARLRRRHGRSPPSPAAREAALLLRRLDTLAGAIDGGFDAPASAELLLNAVDAAVPARRRAVLVGFGNDPAVPLALRGADRVPWQDPALDDSVLGRVWRTGRAEYGALQVDGDSRPLLAAALRDPMGDRIGVVVLERAPGTGFDDADLAAVSEVAERHSPNLDVSLIFAALRERAGFEERERLAREMHDGIAQELVALGYRVDVLRRRASNDDSALAGPLDEASGTTSARSSPTCGCRSPTCGSPSGPTRDSVPSSAHGCNGSARRPDCGWCCGSTSPGSGCRPTSRRWSTGCCSTS